MASLPKSLSAKLEEEFSSVIERAGTASGGSISSAAAIGFESGEVIFVKWNAAAPEGFFAAEARGLEALRQTETLVVPRVVSLQDETNAVPAHIVLELLSPAQADADAEAELGRGLAALHRTHGTRFGNCPDNFIGLTPQRNRDARRWGEFFFENRLRFQAELGAESGWFDYRFDKLLAEKQGVIVELLDECPDEPSLLHGDLWSGNVYFSSKGPAVIDPAVYYGSREADLAFTELFGRRPAAFYQGYHEAYPLSEQYPRRKPILNLYHLMNHSNLFGGSYIGQAYRCLQSIK